MNTYKFHEAIPFPSGGRYIGIYITGRIEYTDKIELGTVVITNLKPADDVPGFSKQSYIEKMSASDKLLDFIRDRVLNLRGMGVSA